MSDTRTLKVVVVGTARGAQSMLKGLGNEVESTGSRVSRVGGSLASKMAMIGTTAAVGFGAVAAGVAVVGLKAAVAAEQNEMAMTTILGSSEKAKAFLEDISDFAAKTPFDLPTLTDAAKRLTAVGTETKNVLPLMEALGDATSGMGTGAEGINRAVTALGQMRVKGKVTGEEMLQLAEAGIPAWEALATQLGVSTGKAQEMVTAGKVSVDDLFTAIQTKQGSTFQKLDGMMDKQSQTVGGMWSTLQDTFQQGAGNIMRAFFPLIKDVMPGLISFTEKAAASISKVTNNLGPVKAAIAPVANALKGMFSGGGGKGGAELAKTFGVVKDFISDLMPVVKDLGQQFMSKLGPAIKSVGEVITNDVLPAIRAFLPAITPVAKFMLDVMGSSVIGMLMGLAEVVKGVFKVIAGVINVFTGILTGDWSKAWQGIKQILSGALQIIWGLVKVFFNGNIMMLFRKLGGLLKGLWLKAWNGIKQAFQKGVIAVAKKVLEFKENISRNFKKAMLIAKVLLNAGWNYIKAKFAQGVALVKSIISKVVEFITAPFRNAFNAAKNLVSTAWNTIKQKFQTGVADVKSKVAEMPGKIKEGLGNCLDLLKQAGRDVVQGLMNGIGEMKDDLMSKASEIAGSVKDAFTGMLDIRSPSRVMKGIGIFIIRGLIQGISHSPSLKALSKQLVRVGDRIRNMFKDRKINADQRNDLLSIMNRNEKRIREAVKKRLRLQTRLETVEAELRKRQARLAQLKDAKNNAISSSRDAARDFGSFMGTLGGEGESNGVAYILSRFNKRLEHIRAFRSNLAALGKRGLGAALLSQVASAGPDEGGAMAAALMGASSGDLQTFNDIGAAIEFESNALGQETGALYNSEIRAAEKDVRKQQPIVNHIRVEVKGSVKAEKDLAESIAKAVKAVIDRDNSRNGRK